MLGSEIKFLVPALKCIMGRQTSKILPQKLESIVGDAMLEARTE